MIPLVAAREPAPKREFEARPRALFRRGAARLALRDFPAATTSPDERHARMAGPCRVRSALRREVGLPTAGCAGVSG
jgi:hypothetical protein